MEYTEKECISSLRKAAESLGKSPTHAEYNSMDIAPSVKILKRKFGSWNKAKEAASLEKFTIAESGPSVSKVPDNISFTQKEWEELTCNRRDIWRKRLYVRELKDCCVKCGFDKSVYALDFHHIESENKFASISELIQQGYSYERIDNEIDKCELLCANCHRIEEYGTHK